MDDSKLGSEDNISEAGETNNDMDVKDNTKTRRKRKISREKTGNKTSEGDHQNTPDVSESDNNSMMGRMKTHII